MTPDIYPYQKGYGGRNPINLYEALLKMGHDTTLVSSVPHNELGQVNTNDLQANIKMIRLYSTTLNNYDFEVSMHRGCVICLTPDWRKFSI